MNLAARLVSACRQYGARILISEFTYRALRGTYRKREVDIAVVKGKPGRFRFTRCWIITAEWDGIFIMESK